jgi:hypothetical protein
MDSLKINIPIQPKNNIDTTRLKTENDNFQLIKDNSMKEESFDLILETTKLDTLPEYLKGYTKKTKEGANTILDCTS